MSHTQKNTFYMIPFIEISKKITLPMVLEFKIVFTLGEIVTG